MLIAFFFSCKKEFISNEINTSESETTFVGGQRSGCTPSLVNGRLKFQNSDCFVQYYNSLLSLPDSLFDLDSLLLVEEQSFAHSSYRKVKFNEFEALNELGFETLEDIPVEKLIYDIYLQSILNEDAEVQVDQSVLKFIDANTYIDFPTANETDIALANNHTFFNGDGELVLDDFQVNLNEDVLVKAPKFNSLSTGGLVVRKMGDVCRISGGFSKVECKPNEYVAGLSVLAEDNSGSPTQLSASWIIYPNGYSSSPFTSTAITPVVNFVYNSAGPKEIIVQATFQVNGATQTLIETYNINVVLFACSEMNKRQGPEYVYPSSGRAFSCEIYNNRFLGKTTVGAWTKAYEWKNQKWRLDKVRRIRTQVINTFRKPECGVHSSKNDVDICKNCRSELCKNSANILGSAKHGANTEVYSYHSIKDGNTWHPVHKLELVYCE